MTSTRRDGVKRRHQRGVMSDFFRLKHPSIGYARVTGLLAHTRATLAGTNSTSQ